jgi:hypothetical protein
MMDVQGGGRTMMRRVLSLAALAVIVLAAPGARAREIRPHMAGWEQILSLEYAPGLYKGQPAVEGTVTNISPYDLTNIRLLVDTLDAGGEIKNQQVAWVPGELRGGGRLFFSVPTTAAPAYRVRVFTYDRIEAAGGNQR